MIASEQLAGLRALADAVRVPPQASGKDARLMALLSQTYAAEAGYEAACHASETFDDDATVRAAARLRDAVASMAEAPADTLLGLACKAARICFTLDNMGGHSLGGEDDILARSLGADIERLLPGIRAS